MQRCRRGGSAVLLQHGEISSSESMNSDATRTGTITYLKTIRLIVTEPALREMLCHPREYWILYRGPGFLASVWLGSTPTPSPRYPVRELDRRHAGRLGKRDNLLTVEGEEEWATSLFKKAWSSKNHSILSVASQLLQTPTPTHRRRALPDYLWHGMHYLHHFKANSNITYLKRKRKHTPSIKKPWHVGQLSLNQVS
jgi:hypothetical protein